MVILNNNNYYMFETKSFIYIFYNYNYINGKCLNSHYLMDLTIVNKNKKIIKYYPNIDFDFNIGMDFNVKLLSKDEYDNTLEYYKSIYG